jgi:hypothetical protein
MSPNLISGLFGIGEKLIDSWFPNQEEADKRKAEFALMVQQGKLKELETMASVIKAEATSGSWLTANWRPLTMITFVALICAHWLGFTAENLSEDQVISLLDIVKVGLGGYVVGRSGEKIVKTWKGKE